MKRAGTQPHAEATLKLKDYLSRDISWAPTGDEHYPWVAQIGKNLCRIRLNDFPAEQMYTLLVGNREISDFDNWPRHWQQATSSATGAMIQDIVDEIVVKTGITKTKAEMAVETVFESMKRFLGRGERIELRDFGTFNVRPRGTGVGRNPRTGVEVPIRSGKAGRFKPVRPV